MKPDLHSKTARHGRIVSLLAERPVRSQAEPVGPGQVLHVAVRRVGVRGPELVVEPFRAFRNGDLDRAI